MPVDDRESESAAMMVVGEGMQMSSGPFQTVSPTSWSPLELIRIHLFKT